MVRRNKTKIIATIGPASSNKRELNSLVAEGVDIFRINGAHGTLKEHKRTIARIREVTAKRRETVAILIDLPGPKFRVGKLKREPVNLKAGDVVILECGKTTQTGKEIPVPYRNLNRSVKTGSKIFINDGIVELRVLKINGRMITCKVKAGGPIATKKGINLPFAKLNVPSLTARDKEILDFAIREDVDYVALSFVRSAKDIMALKRIIKRRAPHIGVIAKIEKPEALRDLENIIAVSDAIMVARGDLGIEMPFDQIPLIQKNILRRCLVAQKPSITATQMLESMVSSKKPTRAEATDVAGAVWDGSDAVMLSAETSVGANPSVAVSAMRRIATEAETQMPHFALGGNECDTTDVQAKVLSCAAGFIAEHLNARAIVTPTRSGRTPLFVSNDRPAVIIVAPTEDARVARRMCLYWGVRPIAMPNFKTVDQLLNHAERMAKRSGFIKKGDRFVITSGAHGKKNDITRLVEVRTV
jgi:pyruvate kinase